MRYDLDGFGVVPGTVVVQAPRRGVFGLALLNAHNNIAIPRPGVIPVVLARARRGVRVRMIPPDEVELLLAGGFFRQADIVGRDFEAVARRIVATVCQGQEVDHLAGIIAIASEERPTALVRVGLHAVRMDSAHHLVAYFQRRDAHSSLQNRSVRYFSPESGNTVTITARSSFGNRRATSRQTQSAAPALTPTRIPSSRARRRAISCASSVRASMFSSARFGS